MNLENLWMLAMLGMFGLFLRGLQAEARRALKAITHSKDDTAWRHDYRVAVVQSKARLTETRGESIKLANEGGELNEGEAA